MEIRIEFATYIYDSIISRVIIGGRQGSTDYGLLATVQACTGTQYGYGCWGRAEDPEIYHGYRDPYTWEWL